MADAGDWGARNAAALLRGRAQGRENTMDALLTSTIVSSMARMKARYEELTGPIAFNSARENALHAELVAFVQAQITPAMQRWDDYPTAFRALTGTGRIGLFGYHNNILPTYLEGYGIGLKNTIAVLWESTKHPEHFQTGVTVADARAALVKLIANGQRGNNRNNPNNDNDNHDHLDAPVCGKGHYNQIAECYKSIHVYLQDVIMDFQSSVNSLLKEVYCARIIAACRNELYKAMRVTSIFSEPDFTPPMDDTRRIDFCNRLPYTDEELDIAVNVYSAHNPQTYHAQNILVNEIINHILGTEEYRERSAETQELIRSKLEYAPCRDYILAMNDLGITAENLEDAARKMGVLPGHRAIAAPVAAAPAAANVANVAKIAQLFEDGGYFMDDVTLVIPRDPVTIPTHPGGGVNQVKIFSNAMLDNMARQDPTIPCPQTRLPLQGLARITATRYMNACAIAIFDAFHPNIPQEDSYQEAYKIANSLSEAAKQQARQDLLALVNNTNPNSDVGIHRSLRQHFRDNGLSSPAAQQPAQAAEAERARQAAAAALAQQQARQEERARQEALLAQQQAEARAREQQAAAERERVAREQQAAAAARQAAEAERARQAAAAARPPAPPAVAAPVQAATETEAQRAARLAATRRRC